MSRDELIVVVYRQAARITAQAGQLAELMEANEALAGKLARLEHLLSRNSGNSSSPPSHDDDPGRTPPKEKRHRDGGPKRSRGKQPGAAGANLSWTGIPDERTDQFPQAAASAVMTWPARVIWEWSIATSSMRSRGSA
ncbi:MAG: DUF6444 domain-containing protein [Actinobacteria bacterium]|nr:DUF6444 domain-containing protein [Actinomycetota bacterium]